MEKRPNGPYASHYEDIGESHAIEWSTRQMGGEQRSLEMSPEIEDALRDLRDHVGGQ